MRLGAVVKTTRMECPAPTAQEGRPQVARRGLASLWLVGILVIGLAPMAVADTFGSLTGDQDTAEVQFSRWHDGVRQDWFVFALRDRLAGVTTVDASYSADRAITCRDGSDGSVSTFFGGFAEGSLVVGRSLLTAAAAARVRGVEESYNSCTDRSSTVTRTYGLAIGIAATSGLGTNTLTQDILWDDDICYLLTQDFLFREAAGVAVVNGRIHRTSSASIGHTEWDSVPQPASACVSPEE